jgi:hypothetical protein
LKRKSDRLDSWSITAETENWNAATKTTAIQTSAARRAARLRARKRVASATARLTIRKPITNPRRAGRSRSFARDQRAKLQFTAPAGFPVSFG